MSDSLKKVLAGAVIGALIVGFVWHVRGEREKHVPGGGMPGTGGGPMKPASAPGAGAAAGGMGKGTFSQMPVGVVVSLGSPSRAEARDRGATEQIFRTILVFTTRSLPNRKPVIKGTAFRVRTISEKALFGMQAAWRGQVKVNVSDPSRTVLDMFNDPSMGGGLRPSVDVLRQYMTSKNKNMGLLMDYAGRLGNGAVFKRLGFILERLFPEELDAIAVCRVRMTKGIVKLDPSLAADNLMTAWQLWVPSAWAKKGLKLD